MSKCKPHENPSAPRCNHSVCPSASLMKLFTTSEKAFNMYNCKSHDGIVCCSVQLMQAPVGTAVGASTLAKLKCCGSEHPPTQRHNNRTRASRHFPDRGKPTPSYASCLALSSREGRNKVTQPTSVRRLVLISLVRQPLLRWSSITVFIVFSFVPVQSDPH